MYTKDENETNETYVRQINDSSMLCLTVESLTHVKHSLTHSSLTCVNRFLWQWAKDILNIFRPTWGIASLCRTTEDFYPRIHRGERVEVAGIMTDKVILRGLKCASRHCARVVNDK
jgi:hypothetical protein